MNKAILPFLLIILLITACEATPQSAILGATEQAVAVMSPTVTEVDPVLRATMEAAQATNAAQTQTSLDIQRYQAEATLTAAELQAEQIRASQTAIVANTQAAATAQSIQMTEAAAQITRQAEATATERAWLAQGWTATADASIATATAQAGLAMLAAQATQTQQAANVFSTQAASTEFAAVAMMNRQATLDTANIAAASTAVAAQAVEAEAAAQRTRLTNEFLAWFRFWGPPAVLVVLILLGILALKSHTRNRVIPRDDRGSAPILVIDGKVTNPDLMMFPMLDEHADVSPDLQAAHAGNMAKVQAVRALPPGENQTGRRIVRSMASSPQSDQAGAGFSIMPPDDPRQSKPLAPGVRSALDQQWSGNSEDDEQ